jgi:hypothetical protein
LRIASAGSQTALPFDRCEPYDSGSKGPCCNIGSGTKTLRVEDGGLAGPGDDHHGRGLVGLDQLKLGHVCGKRVH